MRGLAAALIFVGLVLVCATSWLLVRIWLVRHSFDMAARSPGLLICVATTALGMVILILLHWFLLLEGQGLPCYATYWGSFYWYCGGFIPYILRTLRIVVVYHSSYRYKYARYVKWRNLRNAWAACASVTIIVAATGFVFSARHYSTEYGCTFFEEGAVNGLVSLCTTPILVFLLCKLRRMNDAFKLRREMCWTYYTALLLSTTTNAIQGLTESRPVLIIADALSLVLYLNALFWMALVSVAIHDGWCGSGMSGIVPMETYAAPWPPEPTVDGVFGFLQEGGVTASMFQHFCSRNLCAESWDFIVAACQYEALSDPEEQYKTFVSITELYLRPTSPQEVNISSSMQGKIAALQDKEKFLGLGDSRRNVLQAPLKEIVRMLEDNLLTKFQQSPEMMKRKEDLKRQSTLRAQAESAAAEGDENMREQLLLSGALLSRNGS